MQLDNNKVLLPTELLHEYINTFYGYGSWSTSKFWFIGIEEGGGNSKEELQRRLDSWVKLGKGDLIDCKSHHLNTHSFPFHPLIKMHSRTWTRLTLAKLGFQAIAPTSVAMLTLLNNEWGQPNSDNLLVELFPLPSPGVKNWNYPCWVDLETSLSFLASRKLYKQHLVPGRIRTIKSKIQRHRPEVVLFYGKSMEYYWDEIIGTSELSVLDILGKERYRIRYKVINATLFVQCPQPTYIRGYAFWTALGKQLQILKES